VDLEMGVRVGDAVLKVAFLLFCGPPVILGFGILILFLINFIEERLT